MIARSDDELGLSAKRLLERQYGIAGATLENVGAFLALWAILELDLERAIWRLTAEDTRGKRPTTDNVPMKKLVSRFRDAANGLPGQEWHRIISLMCETIECLSNYRNALAHGQPVSPKVGGGLALNPAWFGELRKRPGRHAHTSQRLGGMMLEALYEVASATRRIAVAGSPPNQDARVLEKQKALQRARGYADEVLHLTEAMNSEKY